MVMSVDKEKVTEDKTAIGEWSCEISAIARGIEAKHNLITGFSKIVTQQTIDIARQLDIPEKEVRRWVTKRSMFDSEGNRIIQFSLNKLK